ncbi:unnamed protein product [Somion occarium]|uniref:Uncharacterized protein n=1 Tax=Somion occarium TaxID=3059160 RepID=A0ABP1DTD5_9APHY
MYFHQLPSHGISDNDRFEFPDAVSIQRTLEPENHAAISTSLKAVKENLIRYHQFHVLTEPSDKLRALDYLSLHMMAPPSLPQRIEDLITLFGDEEYQQNAVPDETDFLNRNEVQPLVGEEQVKYEKA